MFDWGYWADKAEEYMDENNYYEAINCYKKILEQNSNDTFALTNIGSCFSYLGQLDKAIIYVNKALDIDPNDYYLWYNKGIVYYDNKNYEDALIYFDKATSLKQDNSTSWYFKGWCYFYLKNINKAIECFEISYDIEPDVKLKDLINDLKNNSPNNMQCPNCHAEIDERYKFCIKCGFDLRNISNQNPYEDLEEMVNHVVGYAEMMDEHSYYLEESPLVYDWKDKDLSVKLAVIGDFIDWLVYLGLADGYIAPDEVKFINIYLGFDFTQNDIIELIPKRLDEDYFSKLPISFKLFHDNDFLHKEYQNERNIQGTAEFLFDIFGMMGELFIACDGDINPNEKTILNSYMMNLRSNLDSFKNNEYPFLREGLIEDIRGY